MKLFKTIIKSVAVATLLGASMTGFASDNARYEVTITNITKGQTFTPQLTTVHSGGVRLFTMAKPASEPIAVIAESGNPAPLTEALLARGDRHVGDVQTNGALLGPGESVKLLLEAPRSQRFFSMAAMLIPTNDTFVALNRVRLPAYGSKFFKALAYDAGTEANDQNCANIPGPRCGGEGSSDPADGDEGFIHISNGFHELGRNSESGDEILGPHAYDWRNHVATVRVKKLH